MGNPADPSVDSILEGGLLPLPCLAGVTRADTVCWERIRHGDASGRPGLRHQGGLPGDDRSAGLPICTTAGRPKGGAHGCAP
jgi:hypothetical protein